MFDSFAEHEELLAGRLLNFLNSKNNVQFVGDTSSSRHNRVPTISFMVKDKKNSTVTLITDKKKIGIRYGHFYAKRLIDVLDLESREGVVRISLVHYNTIEEVERLISILDTIL